MFYSTKVSNHPQGKLLLAPLEVQSQDHHNNTAPLFFELRLAAQLLALLYILQQIIPILCRMQG